MWRRTVTRFQKESSAFFETSAVGKNVLCYSLLLNRLLGKNLKNIDAPGSNGKEKFPKQESHTRLFSERLLKNKITFYISLH